MTELPENIADAPEIPIPSANKPIPSANKPIPSANKPIPSANEPRRRGPGRRITKENAKEMAISAAKAKAMRKEAREKMLAAMCTSLDLGKELVDAIRKNDLTKITIVDKALHIVGLQHDQSPDAQAQKISLDAKTDNRVSGNVNITVKGLDVD